jgi:hypothetical protein
MPERDSKGRFFKIEDDELRAINGFVQWARFQSFDAKWRALSYLCARCLNKAWQLAQPKE